MEIIKRKILNKESRMAQRFHQLQILYDMIPQLKDERCREDFIDKVKGVEKLRTEFNDLVDECNMLQFEINPDYAAKHDSITGFDSLYDKIMSTFDKITKSEAIEVKSTLKTAETKTDSFIKIPRIDLPYFDGEIQNFPFFYETFKQLIHDNPKLTDGERVHYLFSHLTGKAKSICAGIIPASNNYSIVWDALLAKYYDKRALATSYLNKLFCIKNMNGPSADNLEKFIDEFNAIISGLKQLHIDHMDDFIFVHLGLKLLDSETAQAFEMYIRNSDNIPKYDEFLHFVREQAKILQRTSREHHDPSKFRNTSVKSNGVGRTQLRTYQSFASTYTNCIYCQDDNHSRIYDCKQFLSLTPNERYKFTKDNSLCFNCLNSQHRRNECKSKNTCRSCRGKHHSLLHFDNQSSLSKSASISQSPVPSTSKLETKTCDETKPSICTMSASKRQDTTVELLATAKVLAVGKNGKEKIIRSIIDPGSQKHYVTSQCCVRLGLTIDYRTQFSVQGIGGQASPVRGSVILKIRSRLEPHQEYTLTAFVLDQITTDLPTCRMELFPNHFTTIPLADDTWAVPGPVDLLIGVGLFSKILLPNKVINSANHPSAICTTLGYVIMGEAFVDVSPNTTVSCCATFEVENLMKKFWEIEDVGSETPQSFEDKQTEEFYKSTLNRTENGKYEVALPFELDPSQLDDSFKTAERRFYALERKFNTQPELNIFYDEVIKEHINKNYLSLVDVSPTDKAYYIPHHAVRRDDKATTKLKVVLDASAKTESGLSLNEILRVGPSLQKNLFNILVNLRLFPIAISADVRQMYLCINVRSNDRAYQRILYRFDSKELIRAYQYNRVAFGLKCNPFLALRTIQQLSEDESHRFPIAKEIINRDIYMDDIASSIANQPQAIKTAQELIDMFNAGGFQLAKLESNSPQVLQTIPAELRLIQYVSFEEEETLKVLSLRWYPAEDFFVFEVVQDDRPRIKRYNMLSIIARLFDLMGLVAPMILFAKLIIKELWISKLDWDEPPPSYIVQRWKIFNDELLLISTLKNPRHIGFKLDSSIILLGFADASEKTYGGVVYARVTTPGQQTQIYLVYAKSKVAPLKIVSLARLELYAALLLSQLLKEVMDNYSSTFNIREVYEFLDSTVTLSWIHASPPKWQNFVANRVAKIQEIICVKQFYHIRGTGNPSDCLLRGLTPAQLSHPLWLTGPPWMEDGNN